MLTVVVYVSFLSTLEGTTFNLIWFGGNSGEITPVPMPNTVFKLSNTDGSWGFAPERVGCRQAKQKTF